MKYIATSSLNIDNILSSESISPIAFYKERLFGYKSFERLEGIPVDNVILLFSQIPQFSIYDRNRENYPMVLQIEDEEQLKSAQEVGEYVGCKVFAYADTIYLTPTNCKILFFSKKEEIMARQNCLDSLMNKLIDYFQFQTVNEPIENQLQDLVANIEWNSVRGLTSLPNENQHDKAKGFVYGYYLGATKGVSSQTAKMRSLQKRTYDIISSILNNGGSSNAVFDEELRQLDKEIHQADPSRERAKQLWAEAAQHFQLPVDSLNDFLKDIGCENIVKQKFCSNRRITFPPTLSDYRQFQLQSYNQRMAQYVDSIVAYEQRRSTENFIVKSLFDIAPDYSTAMLAGEDSESMLFNSVLNRIVWDNVVDSTENLCINRGEVAYKITVIISEIIKEQGKDWNGSQEQLYFHHLRENIQNFTPFNVCDIDNLVLQSLAAFILKGEDYDALVSYMETAAIPVYKYALSLWGATIGYVQMPRTIVPKQFARRWFESELYGNICAILHHTTCPQGLSGVMSAPSTPPHTETAPIVPNIEGWRKGILMAFEQLHITKKLEEFRSSLNEALAKNGDNMDYVQFFAQLKDYPCWKTKTKTGCSKYWTQLRDKFCKEEYEARFENKPQKGKKCKKISHHGFLLTKKTYLRVSLLLPPHQSITKG